MAWYFECNTIAETLVNALTAWCFECWSPHFRKMPRWDPALREIRRVIYVDDILWHGDMVLKAGSQRGHNTTFHFSPILRFSLPPDPPLRKMECMYLSDGTFVIMVMITFLTGYFGRETGREISASCKIHFLNTSIHPAKIFDDAMKNQVMLLTKLEKNTSGSFLVLGRMRCFEAIFGVIQPSLKCRFYAGIKRY